MKYGVIRAKFHDVYSGLSNVCFDNLQWIIVKYDYKGTLNFIINRRSFLQGQGYIFLCLKAFISTFYIILIIALITHYTEKKMLLNQKHFFPNACILLIHKNILLEPINMLLIL